MGFRTGRLRKSHFGQIDRSFSLNSCGSTFRLLHALGKCVHLPVRRCKNAIMEYPVYFAVLFFLSGIGTWLLAVRLSRRAQEYMMLAWICVAGGLVLIGVSALFLNIWYENRINLLTIEFRRQLDARAPVLSETERWCIAHAAKTQRIAGDESKGPLSEEYASAYVLWYDHCSREVHVLQEAERFGELSNSLERESSQSSR